MNFFQDDTDLLKEIRKQILIYNATKNMNDRERAVFLGLPEGCRIRENAKILRQDKFKCGKYVWIGEGAVLDAQGGLEIGDYTQVGLYVMIWTHTTYKQALRSETCKSGESIIYKPTSIGKNCFIAGPSVIAPGVNIGDKSIIAPCSFVDKDLAAGTMFNNDQRYSELQKQVSKLAQDIEKIKILCLNNKNI